MAQSRALFNKETAAENKNRQKEKCYREAKKTEPMRGKRARRATRSVHVRL